MSNRKPTPTERVFDPSSGRWISLYAPPGGKCTYAASNDHFCVECASQFRTLEAQYTDRHVYDGSLSKDEASKITTSYAKSIKENLEYLQGRIAVHGNTIISRWRKKSRDKRSEMLLKAFPNIFPEQWNMAVITYKYGDVSWRGTRYFREAQLLPWLNLPSLRDDPYKLLALLHYRTKFGPEEWVSFDRVRTRSHWAVGGFSTEFADGSVVLHGTRYGDFVPFNEEQAHRWDTAGFPRGRLILEAQHVLMGFLRRIVEDLLDGIDQDGASDKWGQLVDAHFRRAIGVETWYEFSNQGYSPPIFKMDRMADLAKVRLSEAEDDLFLLQTDAAYFQVTMKAAVQGLLFKGSKPEELKPRVAWSAWSEPVKRVLAWKWVLEEIENVQKEYISHRDEIRIGKSLPESFGFAMASLELLLINLLLQRSRMLSETLPTMAGFEGGYKFDRSRPGGVAMTLDTKKFPTMKHMFYDDPLFWCMLQLASNPEDETMFDPAILFEFLNDWLEKETTTAKEKARLEPTLLDALSDFATNHELLAAVRQFQPLFTPTSTEIAQEKCLSRAGWRGMDSFSEKSVPSKKSLDEITTLFLEFEATPFPKGKRDGLWLEKANIVRQHSIFFWAKAREIHKADMGKSKRRTTEDKRIELDLMSADTSPEHLAALELERMTILMPKLSSKLPENSGSGWTQAGGPNGSDFLLPSRPKEKIKSRPEGSAIDIAVSDAVDSKIVDDVVELIKVKPDSVRTLTRMFPSTTEEYSAKPLDWKNFLQAMEDAGFLAAHCGGSAVMFTKNGEGRIVFHKPHPVAKVDQIMLQSWGKRMRKWFGWQRDTFVS